MEKALEAAIIGYYKSGATIEQIVGLTNCYYLQIARVIEQYYKKQKS